MTRELSPQQSRVMALVARGMENKQIAFVLGVSVSTVKNSIHETLLRLGCSNRTEATLWWLGPNNPSHQDSVQTRE